ncbi:hypothetical protein N431DRAFT_500227 [Stipitochalara longipes BDJ]|nr:hypothetical protein N431DRAFT_500227 [Stipitochalara longipes BDJ]
MSRREVASAIDGLDQNPSKFQATKQSPSDDKHLQSRYCPEEAPHCGCQVQCLTLKTHQNHEKFLKGINNLDKWNINREDALKAVYRNFQRRGNNFTVPTADTAVDISTLDKHVKDKHTALMLPTCISERTFIKKFNDDPRSNETSQFMYALGLAPGQRDYETGVVDELLLQICKWFSRRLLPREILLHLLATYR